MNRRIEMLDSGLTIVTQPMPGRTILSVRVFVRGGSRRENREEHGAAHFCEHIMFKSVQGKALPERWTEIDSIGGQINACSTKEYTCFYGTAATCHSRQLFGILADMVRPDEIPYDENEVEKERKIIIEELHYAASDYSGYLLEELVNGSIGNSGLNQPVIGTSESIKSMDGEFISKFKQTHFTSTNMVVSVAGGISNADVDDLKNLFSFPSQNGGAYISDQPIFIPLVRPISVSSELNHLVMLFPTYSGINRDKYGLEMIGSALGSGYSSRLNQSLREEKGICYSAYSFVVEYSDIGFLGINITYGKENEHRLLSAVKSELDWLSRSGITENEFCKVRKQVIANTIIDHDSVDAVAEKNGLDIMFARDYGTKEAMLEIQSVSQMDLQRITDTIIQPSRCSIGVIGAVRQASYYRELLD